MRKLLSLLMVTMVLLATLSTRASASTYTATKVSAVALGCPYHCTLRIQDNNLVISGDSPDAYADAGNSFKLDLIEPVDYENPSIDGDGLATLDKSTIDLASSEVQKRLHPTVIKSITRVLTYDTSNLPKIALSGLSDGLYNIRVSLSSNWADCPYLYCDEILVVVQSGKFSLQVLPNYIRYTYFGVGCMTYEGYSLTEVH